MENTAKVLFEDDSAHWYIALGERWTGPHSASDVYKKVLDKEISWAHYVWKPGQTTWERICDVKVFQALVPTQPAKAMQAVVKAASEPALEAKSAPPPAPRKSEADLREWYLHYNDSQFGPFSGAEVHQFLVVGKIHGAVYAWKDGMKDWEELEKISRFDEAVQESKRVRAEKKKEKTGKDKRTAPRLPFVAKIIMANDDSVIVAICRDISIGGMQVLTDQIPGTPGTRIKLNVNPSAGVEPFVAEGVIVRILEDGRGFSFRFERLPENARRSLEAYIASHPV